MTLTKEKTIKFTETNYWDCKYAGLKLDEIANVFGFTLEELKTQARKIQDSKTVGRKTKITYKDYKQAIKKGLKKNEDVAEYCGVSVAGLKNRKTIWNKMGLPLDLASINEVDSTPKLSLVEFATLRDLRMNDSEIIERTGVSPATFYKRKKEWKEIGLMDSVGQVTSATVKAFTLDDYYKYRELGLDHKEMARRSGIKLETVKTYIKTWERMGLKPKTTSTKKLVVEVKGDEMLKATKLELDDLKEKYGKLKEEHDLVLIDRSKIESEYIKLQSANTELTKEIVRVLQSKQQKQSIVSKFLKKFK